MVAPTFPWRLITFDGARGNLIRRQLRRATWAHRYGHGSSVERRTARPARLPIEPEMASRRIDHTRRVPDLRRSSSVAPQLHVPEKLSPSGIDACRQSPSEI